MKQSERKLTDLSDKNIGDIVADYYHAAGVFKEFGIDFCCGGGVTLQKACEKRDLNIEEVLSKLTLLQSSNQNANQNYNAWEPGYLIDHIEQTHHSFVQTKIPEITAYATKVARVHGAHHPENVKIYEKFLALSQELLHHLKAEKERVFPLIREIFNTKMRGDSVFADLIASLRDELELMEDDHEEAGDVMKEIRELSNDFTPPQDACATYRILYQNLAGFEDDLHKHVHLENNILFKKAEKLIA
ncbi:iron-sulfur cluster repair di-iron protein [soil metagenome]